MWGLMLAGTALSAYSSYRQSKAQEAAARAKAQALENQAVELEKRFEINKKLTMQEAEVFKATQIGGYAKGGVDISTGTPLLTLEQTNLKLSQELSYQKQDLEYQTAAIRAGAAAAGAEAAATKRARFFEVGAIGLTGASEAADQYSRKK